MANHGSTFDLLFYVRNIVLLKRLVCFFEYSNQIFGNSHSKSIHPEQIIYTKSKISITSQIAMYTYFSTFTMLHNSSEWPSLRLLLNNPHSIPFNNVHNLDYKNHNQSFKYKNKIRYQNWKKKTKLFKEKIKIVQFQFKTHRITVIIKY